MKTKSLYVGVVVVGLISGLIGGYAGSRLDEELGRSGTPSEVTQTQPITLESNLVSDIASNVGPSVVSIVSTSESNSFFGSFEEQGSGTGIIISSDGTIMTNRHVVPEGTISIEVTTSDGRVYEEVEVIGRDPRGGVDLAFIKIKDASNLSPAVIGSSDDLLVGQEVVAIGNALGEFQNTVTTGIISGISRPIIAGDGLSSESLTNLLQTDAAINPGNSGGPLLNLSGQVVGINTAVARGENIGFAIAISDIKGVIDGVLESGKLQVPYIGVRFQMITDALAESEDLPVSSGALIRGGSGFPAVVEDSPASKAGLQDQDIVLRIDQQELNEKNQLGVIVGRRKVGDRLNLRVLRDGQEIDVELILEAAPDSF